MNYREQFFKNGYVVIPNCLSCTELGEIAKIIQIIRTNDSYKTPFKITDSYRAQFEQYLNPRLTHHKLNNFISHREIMKNIYSILSTNKVRVWQDQILIKPTGGKPTVAHQDLPFWPWNSSDGVSVWIPIHGSTYEGGTLGFIPGSHRLGLKERIDIIHEKDHRLLTHPKLIDIEPHFVEVPAGSVVLHHPLIVHLSSPNISDKERMVYSVVYFRDGMRRTAQGKHFILDKDGILPGEIIDGEGTPLVSRL